MVVQYIAIDGVYLNSPSVRRKTLNSACEEEIIALQHCRGGSRKAFEAVVRRYMKDAYFIALGFVGNREDALDLSQEAFFRAYRNINRLGPGRKFFPWFYQILKNLCFMLNLYIYGKIFNNYGKICKFNGKICEFME